MSKIKISINTDQFKENLESLASQGKQIKLINLNEKSEIEKQFDLWDHKISEFLKYSFINSNSEYYVKYNRNKPSRRPIYVRPGSTHVHRYEYTDAIEWRITYLNKILLSLQYFEYLDPTNVKTETVLSQSNKIFIVHGRNNSYKTEVARLLEAQKLDPIILHEQPNGGKSLIEKFERDSDVGFAIIIMTGDDNGNLIGDSDVKIRARQNVILEMGYFIGKLGRDRVCILMDSKINDQPSDVLNLAYIELDKADWKFNLGKELSAVGYVINYSNIN